MSFTIDLTQAIKEKSGAKNFTLRVQLKGVKKDLCGLIRKRGALKKKIFSHNICRYADDPNFHGNTNDSIRNVDVDKLSDNIEHLLVYLKEANIIEAEDVNKFKKGESVKIL